MVRDASNTNYSSRRALIIKEILEINQITMESSEGNEETEEEASILTLDAGELLLL